MTVQIKTQQDLQRLIALGKEYEKKQIEKARSDFKSFCKLIVSKVEKFNIVNLQQDWVNVVIDDFVRLLNSQTINRGIYNIPPRTGKTTLLTIFGSAFLLGSKRNVKIAIVNANQEKVNEINQDIKNIVNSEIYQQIFGINDVASKNAIRLMRLDNGSSITFKVSGSNVIGSGYHFLFFDDYLNPNNEKSEARKEQAKMNLSSFLSRKEYNPMSKIIVIEQRIGLDDTTAICQSKWKEAGIVYNHISLPYFFEEDICVNNIIFNEGKYLDMKFNEQDKREIVAERGLDMFQTQYQQNPTCDASAYIKKEYLQNRYQFNPLERVQAGYFNRVIISMDMAAKTKKANDYTAFICIGEKEGMYYVLDILRQKSTAPVLYNEVCDFYFKWWGAKKPMLLIEDKSSGETVIPMLQQQGIINRLTNVKQTPLLLPINPQGSKEVRLKNVLGFFHTNCIILPSHAEWLIDFENELYQFPNGKHDDMVDAISQCLNYVQSMPIFTASAMQISY
jgi:predicted phage terminase large subunit-like protein